MERCLSGHLYAMTRGDEECPVCVANKVTNDRIAELERQLEAERGKAKRKDDALQGTLAYLKDEEDAPDLGELFTEIEAALQSPEVKA